MQFDRVLVNADRMGGVPCVRNLDFPMSSILAMVADGMPVTEVIAEYPDLEAADIPELLR